MRKLKWLKMLRTPRKAPRKRDEEKVTGTGFDFSAKEWRRIEEWQNTHKCRYRRPDGGQYFGCSEGGYEYTFCPTGLGMIATVRCACGAGLDASNPDFRIEEMEDERERENDTDADADCYQEERAEL